MPAIGGTAARRWRQQQQQQQRAAPSVGGGALDALTCTVEDPAVSAALACLPEMILTVSVRSRVVGAIAAARFPRLKNLRLRLADDALAGDLDSAAVAEAATRLSSLT